MAGLELTIVVVGVSHCLLLNPNGQQQSLANADSGRIVLQKEPALLFCHGLASAGRLGLKRRLVGYDLLELFAFVYPAKFCLPTPEGLIKAVGIVQKDKSLIETAEGLAKVAPLLVQQFRNDLTPISKERMLAVHHLLITMKAAGWNWANLLLEQTTQCLASHGLQNQTSKSPNAGLDVWQYLPEWKETAPAPPAENYPIKGKEARDKLASLLSPEYNLTHYQAEDRPGQGDYTEAITPAFQPKIVKENANIVLAEAGTGIGKTLGYIAPATLWAEKNGAPVWISTFTRNLQQQIDKELDRLFPNPAEKSKRVVIRKGRENYLCLLNYEEEIAKIGLFKEDAIGLGLIARWLMTTHTGDMSGSDFPDWLGDIIEPARLARLPDRRGECIHSACRHYSRCFIEQTKRQAKTADLVIINHALAMIEATNNDQQDPSKQDSFKRIVFDEGHHLFEAADSAFSGHLSGRETAELRRWLRGPEGDGRKRGRGLQQRVDEFLYGISEEGVAREALDGLLQKAGALPTFEWRQKIALPDPKVKISLPSFNPSQLGPIEALLYQIREFVYRRADNREGAYDLEAGAHDLEEELQQAVHSAIKALFEIKQPAEVLLKILSRRLATDLEGLDSQMRLRLEQICKTIERRVTDTLAMWIDMLQSVLKPTDQAFVTWFGIERSFGQDHDFGLYRHWLDPSLPFANSIYQTAHGVVITSATLTLTNTVNPSKPDPLQIKEPLEIKETLEIKENMPLILPAADNSWHFAELMSGVKHLASPAIRVRTLSPFNYPKQTKIWVVNDIRGDDIDQIANGMQALFEAAHGGGLGLFTSIGRLRAVHKRIAAKLEANGLPLYAQHVDRYSTHSLIDIFREEENACLLGTDAVRDGVDVPGRSLRLLVFDKVPWPRPNLLHKARRKHFGDMLAEGLSQKGEAIYDDQLTKFKLRQAFGRLIRRKDDHGVFVMLDPRFPSRLHTAFPEGVEVHRCGIKEVIEQTRLFLNPPI